jgi:hypothetical protein
MISSSMRSELDRIKRKIGYDPNSFQSALKRHEARECLALYTGWEHAPSFSARQYADAQRLLEDDTPERWKKDQAIIEQYYAKHPPYPGEHPHPEWGLTPDEMRENHSFYVCQEEWEARVEEIAAECEALGGSSAKPEPTQIEQPAKPDPSPKVKTWMRRHWSPEQEIKLDAAIASLPKSLDSDDL